MTHTLDAEAVYDAFSPEAQKFVADVREELGLCESNLLFHDPWEAMSDLPRVRELKAQYRRMRGFAEYPPD